MGEARIKAAEEARIQAEEARLKAEEEARIKAEAEEEEARIKSESRQKIEDERPPADRSLDPERWEAEMKHERKQRALEDLEAFYKSRNNAFQARKAQRHGITAVAPSLDPWARVVELIDVSEAGAEGGKNTSRMRDLLLSLKRHGCG